MKSLLAELNMRYFNSANRLGVYKYPTKDGFEKTVPIVDIRKK